MLIKEINKKHVEAKLYGNIGGFFTDGNSFTSLLEGFETKGYTEVTLRMHCYGGSVFEGNVMYNALQRTSLKVNIIIDGVAASMGLFLLPSVENVFIAENGFGMVHRPSGFDDGDADAHLATAKLLRDMEGNFIKRVSERTNMTAEEIKTKWFDGKDHWLNADEMVQYGFAKKKLPATAKNIKILDTEITQGLTAEAMYNRFAAFLDNKNVNKNDVKMNPLVTLLVAALQLEGITAESSEADVIAAVTKKFEGLNTRITTLEGEAKAKTTASIKAMLDNAKVPAGDLRTTYEKIGETSGVDALAAILKPQTPGASTDITSLIKHTGGVGTPGADASKNWDWYQKNDPVGLEKMQIDQPDQFKALYKAEYGVDPV